MKPHTHCTVINFSMCKPEIISFLGAIFVIYVILTSRVKGHSSPKLQMLGHLIINVDTAADILVPRTGRPFFLYQPPQTLTYTYKQHALALLMTKPPFAPTFFCTLSTNATIALIIFSLYQLLKYQYSLQGSCLSKK